jgi:enoyl-CoA hydratase/carnithine racemase
VGVNSAPIDLPREGEVFVLRMCDVENRFSAELPSGFHAALDEVERHAGAAALVTTGGGEFYSNGLALDALAGAGADEIRSQRRGIHALFARMLAFPRARVAALNGHAFAGGSMRALAHDQRVMRADRGYACLPEIDLRLSLQSGMTAIITARLPAQTAHEAITTGRRCGGTEACAAGIADEAVAEAALLPRAIERAAALERGLYTDALRILESKAGLRALARSEHDMDSCLS